LKYFELKLGRRRQAIKKHSAAILSCFLPFVKTRIEVIDSNFVYGMKKALETLFRELSIG
jgi:hypothetical protein